MKPRILLVEDDPVSRAFLAAAVEGLPAHVEVADSCAAARDSAQRGACDLWLIDARLPDGSGAQLLADLRGSAANTPALAHTASHEPADHQTLLAAGFLEVLVKPLPMLTLQSAICRALGYDLAVADGQPSPCAELPHWDDDAALAALKGEPSHVVALRRLFLDELAGQCHWIEDAFAREDVAAAAAALHRLRSSCGFVGAARLGEATRMLEAKPRSEFAFERFRAAAGELLAAQSRSGAT